MEQEAREERIEEAKPAAEEVERVEPEAQVEEPDAEAAVAALQEALEAAQAEAARNLEGWQRAQATYENYRRRMQGEQQRMREEASARIARQLLPILDDLERAFANLPTELKEHGWPQGIRLVYQKLLRLLELEKVRPMEVKPGDPFDPLYHEAVLYQEMPGFEEGQIVAVARKGYLQGERVLRPAQVMVAKAPAAAPSQEEGEEAGATMAEAA